MHVTGTRMVTVINRKAGGQEVLLDKPFNFANQVGYDVSVALLPGESLFTTCDYNNTTTGAIGLRPSTSQGGVLRLSLRLSSLRARSSAGRAWPDKRRESRNTSLGPYSDRSRSRPSSCCCNDSREERIAGQKGDGDVVADLIREVEGLVEKNLLATRFAVDDGHHAGARDVHVRPRVEDVNRVGRAEALAKRIALAARRPVDRAGMLIFSVPAQVMEAVLGRNLLSRKCARRCDQNGLSVGSL